MPNWVRNIVYIENKQALKDLIVKKHDRDEFDFNKVIPMPEELDESSDRFLEKLSIEEKLLFLKEHDGVDNWYDWRISNWDTKWNANETAILDDNTVLFDTAWSPPFKIFSKISEMYNTTVEVRYADEGITENSGTIIYQDGAEMDYMEGDKEFCEEVWNT